MTEAPAPGRISVPGIYDMTSEAYHGDPCDGPSLGSTGARKLIQECPAAYRYGIEEPKTEFDIGNSTHLLVLQPDEFKARVVVCIGETAKGEISYDWTTKIAKEKRDRARAEGKIPLLVDQYDDVLAMRDAIMADPVAGLAFQDGVAEQSMFWKDPEFGIWCKTRPDWRPHHRRYLVDIKTSTSANPVTFESSIHKFGYAQQADWYLSGVERIFGERPAKFAFVVVSKKPPYLVSTCWVKEIALQWGAIMNRRARGVFAWCLHHNEWPSYRPTVTGPPGAFDVGLPVWAERDLQRRHENGEFEPPDMAAQEVGITA